MGRRPATINTAETDRQTDKQGERERETMLNACIFNEVRSPRHTRYKKWVHDTDTSQIITINSVRYR